MKSVDRYKKIAKGSFKYTDPKVRTFVPSPNEDDYSNGYIRRYFCQKANDKNGPIQEIDIKGFKKLSDSIFYKTASIKWKISESKNVSSTSTYKTLQQSNMLSIKSVNKIIPNLKLYLPNLSQFCKK